MYYFLAPFIGWFVSGCTKFVVNYFRYGKEAKSRIGNGGFPSTHTTIMTTTVMLIGWNEGFTSAAFGLGVAITYIVMIDATGLRKAVGSQAASLNEISGESKHRESMGHARSEVLGGLVLGVIVGTALYMIGVSAYS